MGQAHTKRLHDDDTSTSDDGDQSQALEDVQRLLDADRIPRMLQEQVQNCLLNSDDDTHHKQQQEQQHDLTMQGFQVNRQVAEYAVSFLRIAALQHKAVTSLSLEHDIQDEASFQILIKHLQTQPSPQLKKMSIQFWPFGTSSAARHCCAALFQSKSNWRVVEIRHSNLVFDNKTKTNMSFITQGLQAQTALEEFTLGHGNLSHPQPVTDTEVAEILKILSSKKRTLRSLVMRDCYDADDDDDDENGNSGRSSRRSMQGRATTKALIQLVQPKETCAHGLDCRLEKLIWDLPCTHELYQQGSEAQTRFLAALRQNETLLWVQLRRVTIYAPFCLQVEACTRRNRNLAQVRQLVQPSLAVTGRVLTALACPRPGGIPKDEAPAVEENPPQDEPQDRKKKEAPSFSILSAMEEAMAVGSLALFGSANSTSKASRASKRPVTPPADPLEVRASASAMFWTLRATVW